MVLRDGIMIAFDPGTINFGFSVVQFTNRRPKILAIGLLRNTINDLTNELFPQQARRFTRTVKYIIERYRPRRIIRIVIERFINRGRFLAGLVEKVSVMIGILTNICRKYRVQLILVTAAAWKNQFHRETPDKLLDIYKQNKPTPPHCIDATLLAMYGFTKINSYRYYNRKLLRRINRKWRNLNAN